MKKTRKNGSHPSSLALLLAHVDPVAGVVLLHLCKNHDKGDFRAAVLLHLHRLHLLLDRLHPGVGEELVVVSLGRFPVD